ncbi:MFS general substrate transporter [Teratosphaeria destructans]|uniref:MFS general substrate transporter n=1 Tax=Teratosphaeria destructans TaxID=418781 RepID=A0A9W7SZ35_9PEZI|nr:MFS general substrate transporter [Teratosphaeria destructans]
MDPSIDKTTAVTNTELHDDEASTPPLQAGVQQIEAVTTAWTTTALITAYVLIWLTYFVEGMLLTTSIALLPYVTSAYSAHSLTPTVSVVSSVVGACTNFTIAKVLDVFGRPHGYLLCIITATIGLVMMAASTSVEAYAAAQVFNTVGNTGLQYSLSVFVADTSSLRNRGLVQAIAYSPNLITCWLGGPISSAFLSSSGGWPWAFGMFAIMVPAVTLPLWALLQWHQIKARKIGLVAEQISSGRTVSQTLVYYARQFDAVGLVLLTAGVALFLLPFNLYTLQAQGWKSPLIISLLVVGLVMISCFVIWERSFASTGTSFLPFSLLTNRTVVGACFLSATLYFNYYCWFSYLSSFLQVVNELDVTEASYVMQVYPVVSVIFGLVAGYLIHRTGRYKMICLYGGIPLAVLGTGLMMYFRKPSHIAYIIMCQVFLAISAGFAMIGDEIAMLAAVSHQHIAVAIATLGFFGNMGGAIGLTVVAAIWQNSFFTSLTKYLPAEEIPNIETIYGDLATQLSYPVGSVARTAIQQAYGDGQRDNLIAGTAVWVAGIAAVLVLRDLKLSDIQQVRGHVF